MSCASELVGGLGNRLFILASGLGISNQLNKQYLIDPSYVHGNIHSTLSYDYFIRDIPKGKIHSKFHLQETVFQTGRYLEIPMQYNLPGDVLIKGYRQADKYFNYNEDLQDKIRYLFSPPSDRSFDLIPEQAAFIHVRRGDYTQVPLHNINLMNYYSRAMATFSNISRWVVFSDDITWCRQQPLFNNCIFIDGYNEIDSLWMMSKCEKGGICANSSFSWWGSWLNPNKNKHVTMPSKWYEGPGFYWQDMYYSGVEVIDV